MTAGISSTNLADAWLNTLKNTSFAAGATLYVCLYKGDPGASGTANKSANSDGPGKAITWGTLTGADPRTLPITATLPSWTLAGLSGSETITHMGVWNTAACTTTFYYSFAVTNKTVSNGDVLNLTAHSVTLTPIAAT